MDDFNVVTLKEARSDLVTRLLLLLTTPILDGFRSIFRESTQMCIDTNTRNNYMMNFQNCLTDIPKWSPAIVERECKRVVAQSGCDYLSELVTGVHIVQLKMLTTTRAGHVQKKINIDIPPLNTMIHSIYMLCAKEMYKRVYLWETNFEGYPRTITDLAIQKNNYELSTLVQECILNAVRDNIPIKDMLRTFLDESTEDDVVEEIREEILPPLPSETAASSSSSNREGGEKEGGGGGGGEEVLRIPIMEPEKEKERERETSLSFNPMDSVMDAEGNHQLVEASKTVEHLEKLSQLRHEQRALEDKLHENEEEDEDAPPPLLIEETQTGGVSLDDSMFDAI